MSNATPTAAETYETHRRDIAAMIEFLRSELDAHAERARAEGLHWGHAGDLGHIRQGLKETLAFAMGRDADGDGGKMIEEAIADAAADSTQKR